MQKIGQVRFMKMILSLIFIIRFLFAEGAQATELIRAIDVKSGHWINWTAISHDGKVMAAATYRPSQSDDYEFTLMTNSGDIYFRDTFENHRGGAFWVALSGTGQVSAVGGMKRSSQGKEVGFVRAYYTSNTIMDVETEGRVNALALSSKGNWLVVAAGARNSESEVLSLFRLNNKTARKSDSILRRAGCRSIALSDDGRIAVCGRFDGIVEAFINDDGKLRPIFTHSLDPQNNKISVRFVNITPDGKWIVASGNNGFFHLWNSSTLKKEQNPLWSFKTIAGHDVYGVAISHDGKYVAAGSSDGDPSGNGKNVLQVVENQCENFRCHPQLYWSFVPDRAPNPGMMFDGTGRWLTLATGFPVGTPGSFYLFDLEEKKPFFQHTVSNMNWPLAISRDGQFMIGGSDDSRIYLFKNE